MVLGEKIWGNSIGANVVYGKYGTTLVPLKVNEDGELVVNLEAATVNIGDVDVLSLPSGNLGAQAKAASLCVNPATDIADGVYVGDIKFGESLPAGTAKIGNVGIDQVTANANEVVVKSIAAGPLPDTTTNDLAAVHSHLAAIETLLQTTGITLLPLDSSIDSINVDKMTKGAVTTAHSAITGTATSAEIDCRGYNSLLVHWVSNQTDKTWTISVTGATGSGLTFVPSLDKTTGLAASEITTDISGFFVVQGIPDYIKIVATEVDDGATVTCKVQPFNM